jgi:hypothetical protein
MHESQKDTTGHFHHIPPAAPRPERIAPQFEFLVAELAQYARQALQLEVSFERFPTNAKAIFDGSRIELNDRIPAEQQAFFLLHLIGHAAQLATLPEWVDPPADRFDLKLHPENEAIVRAYERQASCYGAGLLIILERADLLPWFNHISAQDLEYFIAFCKGEEGNFSKQTLSSQQVVSLFPLELPTFTPVRVRKFVIV